MCGIAGLLTSGAEPGEWVEAALLAMRRAIEHRGPDGTGVWQTRCDEACVVGLTHTRLAIIDLSSAAAQPMTRGDLAVIYNGEIGNYRELRDELGRTGATFRSTTDTEVILQGYARWGMGVLDRLHGMFAFALWDGGRRRLVLARDRFGIKPLYYYEHARGLVFASEVRALLATGLVPRVLDRASCWHYLGYQTAPTPRTLIDGVRLLEPGHSLERSPGGDTTVRRYWDLLTAAAAQRVPESSGLIRDRVRSLVENAVTRHLVGDVPVGLFLSGGIDSGALLSTMSDLGWRPRTFTVSLDDPACDESAAAGALARHFGADHTRVPVRGHDVVAALPEILAATDHPSGDGVNTFVIARAVRAEGLKVALSGLGGDELFGGYLSFRRLHRASRVAGPLRYVPPPLRRLAAGAMRIAGRGSIVSEKVAALVEGDGSFPAMWAVTRQVFGPAARRRLAGCELAAVVPPDAYVTLLSQAFADSPPRDLFAAITCAETRAYMHDVLLRDADQMAMAHGLEIRVPFLDHDLAAFVTAVPATLKWRGGSAKPLLASSLRRPLPAAIVARPKRGFSLPMDRWMRSVLRDYCQAKLGPRGLDARGLLAPGAAGRVWSQFLHRRPGVTWGRVWPLVALSAWLDRHLP